MRTIKHNWRFFQRFLRFKQFFKAVNHWALFHLSSNIQISMCSKISNLTNNCPLIVKISKLHEISEFQNLAKSCAVFFCKKFLFYLKRQYSFVSHLIPVHSSTKFKIFLIDRGQFLSLNPGIFGYRLHNKMWTSVDLMLNLSKNYKISFLDFKFLSNSFTIISEVENLKKKLFKFIFFEICILCTLFLKL